MDEPTLFFDYKQKLFFISIISQYKHGKHIIIKCNTDPRLIDKLSNEYAVFPRKTSIPPTIKQKFEQQVVELFVVKYKKIDALPSLVKNLK